MSSVITYPVQALREHLTGLEAAMAVCMAEPESRPVHKLRTESRKAEALLLLLDLLPGIPRHRREAAAFLRAVSKLRRAAGEVRDLDVQRKMLESLALDQSPAECSVSGAKVPKQSTCEAAACSKAAGQLRKHLGAERDRAASSLQRLIEKRQSRTVRAAEALMDSLEPAKGLAVRAGDILQNAKCVLNRDHSLKPDAIAALTEGDLHSVRKAAKAARYVAESVTEDPALNQAARVFQSLQDAGGQWHDALELARASRRCFGKKHPLTALFRQQRDAKLEAYQAALQSRATGAPIKKRRPSRQTAHTRSAA